MSRFFLFFLFITGSISNVLAQTDSLENVYRKSTDFKTKLEAGNELIFALRFDDRPKALDIARELLHDPRINNYPEAHARAWIRMGIVYDLGIKPDSAVYCNEKALAITSRHKLIKQQASAYNNLGLIYWNYNQLDKATDYITKASTEFEKLKDTINLANAINNLGLIMNEFTLRKKAGEYHRKALTLFTLAHDSYGIGSALHNIAFSHTNNDSAIYYFYKTINWKKKNNDDYGLGKTYHDMAIAYNHIPDSAIHYYDLAIEYQRKSGNKYGVASTLGTTASFLYTRKKEYTRSLALALEASRISSDMGYLKYFWKAEAVLGHIYHARGEYMQAATHYRKAIEAKDSVMSEEKFNTSLQLEFKYNLSQKEKLLAEQKADLANKKHQLAIRESESKIMWLMLMLIVVVAVFLLLLLGWYFNRKRLRNQKIYAQSLAEEREKSLQRTLMGQEEERQRIAKDLHDGIVQDLAALKMNLDQIKTAVPLAQQQHFDAIKTNLEKTTGEVREISHQMMPTALMKLGLAAALEDNLQKILPLHQITHEFFCRGVEERLPDKVEISLYRITQELINNIVKHSSARHVSVSLTKNSEFVVLHVEDNGKGFDTNQVSKGIGLTSMQSRVNIVNGEIRYESGETGTMVIVKVPV